MLRTKIAPGLKQLADLIDKLLFAYNEKLSLEYTLDYSTSVTGTISGDFEDEHELVSVAVVARAADGSIVGGTRTYVDRLPTGGGKVQFEAVFFDPLPDAATFEAYASL